MKMIEGFRITKTKAYTVQRSHKQLTRQRQYTGLLDQFLCIIVHIIIGCDQGEADATRLRSNKLK